MTKLKGPGSLSATERSRKFLLAVEVPRDELAVRIARAILGAKPPANFTAAEALESLGEENAAAMRSAADAAVKYWAECIAAARAPN